MAKVMREKTPLEAAQEELTALRDRLDRSQRNRGKLAEELNTLWEQRTSHAAITTQEIQRRCVELRSLIADEEDVAAALVQKIQERQQDIQRLTREKDRDDANEMVAVAMAEFQDVMAVFADPVSMAENWLRQAQEAAHRYSTHNPGDVNRQLAPKIATVVAVLREINNGRHV